MHSIQRSNQRGIRKNDINIINQEGDHFESSHDTELEEVFFTKKGTKRFESKIHDEIRNLKILKNKEICKNKIKVIGGKISYLKKRLQKSDKLEGKFIVVSNNKIVTCYLKNKTNNLRKYLNKGK